MTLLGGAPAIFGYSALEMASFVNAVILGWNAIISKIWHVISSLLDLPHVPREILSAALFGASLTSTFSYDIFKSERGQHDGFVQNAAFGIRVITTFLYGPMYAVFAVTFPSRPLVVGFALVPLILIFIRAIVWMPRFRTGV